MKSKTGISPWLAAASAKGKGKKLQNHQAGAGKSNRLLMH
jgi:hypothetical protein